MTSIPVVNSSSRISLDAFRASSPLLWRTSLAFLIGFAVCLVLAAIDPRLFNGVSVWIKPAKFFLSLAVHMLTVMFGLMLLPEARRMGLIARGSVLVLVAMAIFEMVYIAFRAARGEASHFNIGSEFAALLYTLMGIGAVLIMVSTAVIGGLILSHGSRSLLARTTGASFVVAAILTIWVGLTLGGMGSHWIGGDMTDATGLPLFGWSTTGGDLRVAHFIGLHLMQVLPVLALFRSTVVVAAAGLTGVAATFATYFQALAGNPLISL